MFSNSFDCMYAFSIERVLLWSMFSIEQRLRFVVEMLVAKFQYQTNRGFSIEFTFRLCYI